MAQPVTTAEPRNGQPRSAADAVAVERFEHHMLLPIILSAVIPLFVLPQKGDPVSIGIAIVSWLVFLVDFVFHERRLTHYLGTRLGRFDLAIVVVTAPWFLFPAFSAGGFVVLLRLARLARVVMATRGARRLFERIGRVALVSLGVMVLGSLAAYRAEHATNPEFANVGDALWWGIVTLTTVGYGDIVPKTATGRWAGVAIMVTGIATLGVLSGSLASFFRAPTAQDEAARGGSPDGPGAAGEPGAGGVPGAAGVPGGAGEAGVVAEAAAGGAPDAAASVGVPNLATEALAREVAQLHDQLARLNEQLARLVAGDGPGRS